jgi:hypothetical protein
LPPNADTESLETGTDSRLRAAKKGHLKTWWGKLTDGGYYFVLIGAELGRFGAEASLTKTIPLEEIIKVSDDVREKLKAAGFEETPAIHFQMEAEY